MKITISGSPGSGHKAVSRLLADRLCCEYVSVSNILSEMFTGDPDGLFTFKSHSNTAMDTKMTVKLLEVLNSFDDLVLDSLLGSTLVDNSLKVFLYYDYSDNCMFAKMLHKEYVMERTLCNPMYEFPYCDCRNYDVYVNVTGMQPADVVEVIIDSMVTGKRGIFTYAENVLPCSIVADTERSHVTCDMQLSGRYIGDMLFIADDIAQLIGTINRDTVLWIDSSIVHTPSPYTVKNTVYYIDWFKALEPSNTHMLLKLMLYHYCETLNTESYREQFVSLSDNGNALQTLMNMGYLS